MKLDEGKKPILVLMAALLGFTALVAFFITRFERSPRINLKPYMAVGEVAAEQVMKLLPRQGRVVIIAMDSRRYRFPAVEVQLDAFRKKLAGNSQIEVVGVASIRSEEIGLGGPEMGLPARTFFEILSAQTNADAVVSFVGVPYLPEEELSNLSSNLPRCVAVSTSGMGLRKLFQAGVVQAAIVPRFEPPKPGAPKPETLRDWFNLYYQVVTPETVTTLPY